MGNENSKSPVIIVTDEGQENESESGVPAAGGTSGSGAGAGVAAGGGAGGAGAGDDDDHKGGGGGGERVTAAAAAAGGGVAHRRRQILPPLLSSPSSLVSEIPSSPSSSSSSSPKKLQQQLRAKSFTKREQYDNDLYNVVSGGGGDSSKGSSSSSSSENLPSLDDAEKRREDDDDDDDDEKPEEEGVEPQEEEEEVEGQQQEPSVVVVDVVDKKKKNKKEHSGTEAGMTNKQNQEKGKEEVDESDAAAAASASASAAQAQATTTSKQTIPTISSSPPPSSSSTTSKIIMSGSWRPSSSPSPKTKATTDGKSIAAHPPPHAPPTVPSSSSPPSFIKSAKAVSSSTDNSFTSASTAKVQETQMHVQEEIRQSLQEQISALKTKCEALESQNILVSVQQLDWFVRLSSNTLWGLTLVGYAKLCGSTLRWLERRLASRSSTLLTTPKMNTTSNSSGSSSGSNNHNHNHNRNNNNNNKNNLWGAYHHNATTFDDIDVDHTVTLKDVATRNEIKSSSSSTSSSSSNSTTSSSSSWFTSSWFTFNSDDWMFVGIQLGMVALPLGYNYLTCGSFRRRLQVFSTAFVVIGRIRLCRWREQHFVQQQQQPSLPHLHLTTDNKRGIVAANNNTITIPRYGESCTNDGIWESNYEISARFLWLSVSRLRGLWTKSAQYLSSRADFMPVSYIRELSKLQDSAPATPWAEIEHLMSPKLRDAIVEVDTTPIASASIGQVHVATIKIDDDDDNDDGNKQSKTRKVVIKIQHPHARTLMTDDFWSLMVICRVVGWLEPDYKFMEILMREWAIEARKELDFTNEAYHLDLARSALEEWRSNHSTSVDGGVGYTTVGNKTVPFQVEVPEPLKEFSNQRVLVMEYCDGCRVDDFQQLSKWNMSRRHVMDALSQTFAYFMYQSPIFNGDPHPGNLFCRPGIDKKKYSNDCGDEENKDDENTVDDGFTLVILDWGLAKQLTDSKRVAFCQMVYAAATLDYGMLLDSYKMIGLKMKRENAGQSMEDMRFFLRDMAPRDVARSRIKSKIQQGQAMSKKSKEKVPMSSKAYPGELFFFIRVNELLHGLGSRFNVDLKYLDTLKPFAEMGLRQSNLYKALSSSHLAQPSAPVAVTVPSLQEELVITMKNLESKGQLVGGQVCVLDKDGAVQTDVVHGSLGGLQDTVPLQRNNLVLGYSCTKGVTATLAHILVQEGYLSLDEPICERVWKNFAPTEGLPERLTPRVMNVSRSVLDERWKWKRQITLRHILNHTAGMWAALPRKLTIEKMAACESCCEAFEYNPDYPEDTLLPSQRPGDESQYHFMSYGWLVAGTLRGAYALKHNKPNATYADVYYELLYPKLSNMLGVELGFCPMGGSRSVPPPISKSKSTSSSTSSHQSFVLANTVTSDVRASKLMQQRRDQDMMATFGDDNDNLKNATDPASSSSSSTTDEEEANNAEEAMKEILKTFEGAEFLLDPRVWNCSYARNANVPAASGRFSAAALARFYHELGNTKTLVDHETLDQIFVDANGDGSSPDSTTNYHETSRRSTALMGVTRIVADGANVSGGSGNDSSSKTQQQQQQHNTRLALGYQLIQTERDSSSSSSSCTSGKETYYSGLGHAGVGGSIGFWHRPTGLCVGLMLTKADGNSQDVTMEILRVIGNYYQI